MLHKQKTVSLYKAYNDVINKIKKQNYRSGTYLIMHTSHCAVW